MERGSLRIAPLTIIMDYSRLHQVQTRREMKVVPHHERKIVEHENKLMESREVKIISIGETKQADDTA